MRKSATICCAAAMLILICSCGTKQAVPAVVNEYPKKSIELIAPAGSGGGYDLTIRMISQCLTETKLVPVPLPVSNKQGGGGILALEYLQEKIGADDIISVFSPPLLFINLNESTQMNYIDDTTPIAKIITSYGLFAVSKDSPYTNINDVMVVLKNNPKSIRIGGVSARGSMDHIQFLKMADMAGVANLDQIEYVGFQDGSAPFQLMGGHVDLISTGISDALSLVESGDIRALATTADRRVGSGIVAEIPTCIEQGINATFYNWRGIFGPKNMPDYAVQYWENTLAKMVQTEEWKEICEKYSWDMTFCGKDEFADFLQTVNEEYILLLNEVDAI